MNNIHTTCGCFLIYNGQVLVVHPTGSLWHNWSIPKGLSNHNESHEDAMFREVYEETNIVIADYKHYLFDIGYEFYINKRKRLHAFVVILKEWDYPPIYCSSTFDRSGLIKPEVDAFIWLPIDEVVKRIQIEQLLILRRNIHVFKNYIEVQQ